MQLHGWFNMVLEGGFQERKLNIHFYDFFKNQNTKQTHHVFSREKNMYEYNFISWEVLYHKGI